MGFSPYFLIERTGMSQLQAVDFCQNIGMRLIKVNNPDINMMATQFAINEGITSELLWLSLLCNPANGYCKWIDGEVLTWADWTSTEPVYECTVLVGSTNWRTRKCSDLYFPFCYAPPHPSFEIIPGSFNLFEASMECLNIGGQLAVVSNSMATLRLQSEYGGMQIDYAWIGLYGNGTHLVWQNMRKPVTYSNWMPGIIDPGFGDDIAVGINMIDFTWKPILKTDKLNYVLCQHNYLPIEDNIDYKTSRQACEMYAWNLALLRTNEETEIAQLAIQYYALMSIPNNFWIGLQWDGTNFTWNDGTPLGFSNWMPGALSTGSTSPLAVEMVPTSSFQWNTKPNTVNELNSYLFPTSNRYPITRHIEIGDDPTTIGPTTESPIQSTDSSTKTIDFSTTHLVDITTMETNSPTNQLTDSTMKNVITSQTTEGTVPIDITSQMGGISTESPIPGSTMQTLIKNRGGYLIERTFYVEKANFQPNASPHQAISSPSTVHCAKMCFTDNLMCFAFVYDNDICFLYDNYQSNNVLQSAGSVIWT